jgi:hypothetical protein
VPPHPASSRFNIDQVGPNGARYRRISHDDAAFVSQVSEISPDPPIT